MSIFSLFVIQSIKANDVRIISIINNEIITNITSKMKQTT